MTNSTQDISVVCPSASAAVHKEAPTCAVSHSQSGASSFSKNPKSRSITAQRRKHRKLGHTKINPCTYNLDKQRAHKAGKLHPRKPKSFTFKHLRGESALRK
jgi:hypothetical protein